jgi:hypothetical protein
MTARLYVTDELGHVADVFQLDRYDLTGSIGQETLIQDIRQAKSRRPSDFAVRPDVAAELIGLLEAVLAVLSERNGNSDGRRELELIPRVAVMLRRLRGLSCYLALDPDGQRDHLIAEMALTALLYEQLDRLIDLADAAVIRSKESQLSYDEFDDLGNGLLAMEKALADYPLRQAV